MGVDFRNYKQGDVLISKHESMNQYDIKRLAFVLAVQAEIEGMKSENDLRKLNNESPAYGYEHFEEQSMRLNNLANAHNEQL